MEAPAPRGRSRRRRSGGGAALPSPLRALAAAAAALAAAPLSTARAFYIPGAFPNAFKENATLRGAALLLLRARAALQARC
jgi:hypothetical protein